MIICMFSRKNGILTSTYNCVCGIDIPGHCNFTKYVFMRCTISRTKQTSRMLFLVHCKWLHMLHRENQRQSKIGKESLDVKICIYIFWQIANLPFKKLPFYQELYIFCSVVVSKFISYLKVFYGKWESCGGIVQSSCHASVLAIIQSGCQISMLLYK